jgi:hypothetical protein
MRHFRFHWREPADGDKAAWGTCYDFWEVDDAGHFTRSVHAYEGGQCLRYDEQHAADWFGQLPEGPLVLDEIDPEYRGDLEEIDRRRFDLAWSSCSAPTGRPANHPLRAILCSGPARRRGLCDSRVGRSRAGH